jgi:hypothetical protein
MSATQPLPEVLQGRLEGDVETIAAPSSPRRPWVVASGELAFKAYDLSQFDAVDRSRLLGEAETALALADIDGVVDTHGFEVVDGWLLIAMERLGESVADYLRAVAAGTRDAFEPARWGVLIEAVARALGEVHRRHRLHRDVKPNNLIFDRAGERLMVADFSVATRQPRRGAGKAGLAGTRRYIAPEVMRGRVGPAADQYGLGVTAGEVLREEVPPSAKAVLLRATEQSPEDRYPSIVDFGLALRSALDDTAPRRISARLQRVQVRWRQTWGVAAAAFAAMYAWLLWSRPSSLGWEDGFLRPLLVMALVALMARMLSRLRGGRTQPRLPLADRGWFPVLLFALAMGALFPLLVDNPSKTGKWAFLAALGALALSAALGSVRRDAGERLIALVRRWESRREGHRGDFVLWWGGRLLALVVVAFLAALPPAFARRWPGGGSTAPAGTPAITVVAMMRSAMLSGRWGRSCALARVPSQPGKAGCARWAPLAGDWLRADVRAGASRLATDDLKDVVLTAIPDAERFGGPMWRIRDRGGDRPDLGWLAEEDDAGRVWEVAISRRPTADDPTRDVEAQWKYEVIRHGGRWRVTAIEACDFSATPACVRVTQLDRDELATVARRGPPGDP